MFATLKKASLSLSFVLVPLLTQGFAHGFELDPQQVNGVYDLATPERSAAGQVNKLELEVGEVNGTKMLATRGCERCPAAAYSYMATESEELGRPVFFNSFGIYILAKDQNTFVSVMGDAQLGKKPWKNLAYANVYSKKGSAGISLEEGKQFAIAESTRLITGEGMAVAEVKGGNGTYYAAVRQAVGANQYDQLQVGIESKKQITLQGMNCRNCSHETFAYQAELSKAIGKNVYETGHMGQFLIEQDKGVLWRVNADLGKALWDQHDQFNLLTQDKMSARQLALDSSAQNQMESTLASYAQRAKAAVDARIAKEDAERTASNQLPSRGLQDSQLEQEALQGAKVWAGQYQWKEALQSVYFIDRDWSILRHAKTGVQTGRRIQGVITMKRDDGLCSYQYASFDQAYNGTGYQKPFMSGVVSGQNKLDCAKL